MTLPPHFRIGDEVRHAVTNNRPVVALESAVFTHGLPHPRGVEAVEAMEAAIRDADAVPATCLVHDGTIWVGAPAETIRSVACDPAREKATARDLAAAVAARSSAGLTVSATLFVAHRAGLRVFATGGIGGVHSPASSGDVSADLLQLRRSPLVTICSGAKSVLDIPRTLEFLETAGVPVFSYRTPHFPAFYLESSGVSTPVLSGPKQVARIALTQWSLGYESAILVGNPIPEQAAISPEDWRVWLDEARPQVEQLGIRGKDVTPALLEGAATASGGRTVEANLALLKANARLGAEVAVALTL